MGGRTACAASFLHSRQRRVYPAPETSLPRGASQHEDNAAILSRKGASLREGRPPAKDADSGAGVIAQAAVTQNRKEEDCEEAGHPPPPTDEISSAAATLGDGNAAGSEMGEVWRPRLSIETRTQRFNSCGRRRGMFQSPIRQSTRRIPSVRASGCMLASQTPRGKHSKESPAAASLQELREDLLFTGTCYICEEFQSDLHRPTCCTLRRHTSCGEIFLGAADNTHTHVASGHHVT
jgi:hypothetical protein